MTLGDLGATREARPERRRIEQPGWGTVVVPAAIYLLASFTLGSLPAEHLPGVGFDFEDKLQHLLVFGGMQWTHVRVWRLYRPGLSFGQLMAWAAATATLAGGALEVWQFLLPHRSADPFDFMADGLGAILAATIGYVLGRARAV